MRHRLQFNRRIRWLLVTAGVLSLFALLPNVVDAPFAAYQQKFPNPTPVLRETVETHGFQPTPVAQREMPFVHVAVVKPQPVTVLDRWDFNLHLSNSAWRGYWEWHGLSEFKDETNELWRFVNCLHESSSTTPLTLKSNNESVGVFRINPQKYFWIVEWHNIHDIEGNMEAAHKIWKLDGWDVWPYCSSIMKRSEDYE
jgi:hypothetical protein